MKSSKKVTRFNYSKFGAIDDWNSPYRTDDEFWGFYPKNGRLHIDTKRYKKVCEASNAPERVPAGALEQRNTVYYVPGKITRRDYKINVIRDLLGKLRDEWQDEFKPLLERIVTPKQVEEATRLNGMAFTSSTDDLDDIQFDALMAGLRRTAPYEHAINSLYCSFIQKIATEVDRCTVVFMQQCGWMGRDYDIKRFIDFSYGLKTKTSNVKIQQLSKYNAYNMLHKINNFLKHNSLQAYEELKNAYPNNVRIVDAEGRSYQNGMFAGDWIIIKKDYIDDVLKKLILFFEDYCRTYLGEDIERAEWDYDDWFYLSKRLLKDPMDYNGLYF